MQNPDQERRQDPLSWLQNLPWTPVEKHDHLETALLDENGSFGLVHNTKTGEIFYLDQSNPQQVFPYNPYKNEFDPDNPVDLNDLGGGGRRGPGRRGAGGDPDRTGNRDLAFSFSRRALLIAGGTGLVATALFYFLGRWVYKPENPDDTGQTGVLSSYPQPRTGETATVPYPQPTAAESRPDGSFAPKEVSFPGGNLTIEGRTYSDSDWPNVVRWANLVRDEANDVTIESSAFGKIGLPSYLDQLGYDLNLILAMVWIESRGNETAENENSEYGLMQVVTRDSGYEWARKRPTRQELVGNSRLQIEAGLDVLHEHINISKKRYPDSNEKKVFEMAVNGYNGSDNYWQIVIGLYRAIKKYGR